MQFIPLEEIKQVEEIKKASGYNIIFKHNTTCPISKSVRASFEQEAGTITNVDKTYILDLLEHRDVSDFIEQQFDVRHESPQLLLIKDGKSIYNESLYNISADKTAEAAA